MQVILNMHYADLAYQRIILHSYVLTGTAKGFSETFGSTCHGAVSIIFVFLYLYVYMHYYG